MDIKHFCFAGLLVMIGALTGTLLGIPELSILTVTVAVLVAVVVYFLLRLSAPGTLGRRSGCVLIVVLAVLFLAPLWGMRLAMIYLR